MRPGEEKTGCAPTVMVLATRHGIGGAAGQVLERGGFRVLAAETVEQAEGLLQTHSRGGTAGAGSPIDAALLEPIAHGPGVPRLRALDSALPIVLLTDGVGAERRRHLARTLCPYAVADWQDGGDRLLEWIESAAVAGAAARRTLEAYEIRSLLAGRLSEDVYGLLQVIRGYAEVLTDESAPMPVAAERLQIAAEAALDLVQSWVDLRRLDRASICPRRQVVDIGLLVEELSLLFRRRSGGRPLNLRARCAVGEACLVSDGEKLQTLLAGLLLDVIESKPSGDVLLEIAPSPFGGTQFLVGPRDCRNSTSTADSSIAVAITQRLGRLIEAEISLDAEGSFFIVRLPSPLCGSAEMERLDPH